MPAKKAPTEEKEAKAPASPKKTGVKKAASPKKKAAAPAASKRDYSVFTGEMDKRLVPASKGRRATKPIEKWTEDTTHKATVTEYDIPKGKGKKLADITHVAAGINKRAKSDELIKLIHGLVIGRASKAVATKENLLKFSGVQDRSKVEGKLEKLKLRPLRDVAAFFGIDPEGERDDLVKHLADMLEKPKDTGETFSTTKKRKRSASRSRSPARSKSPAKKKAKKDGKKKKDPNAPKRTKSAYMFFCADKRPEVMKKLGKVPVTEAATELGKMWKKVSAADKKKYEEKSAKDKSRYEKEMKKYNK